jgi:hypothetical protein
MAAKLNEGQPIIGPSLRHLGWIGLPFGCDQVGQAPHIPMIARQQHPVLIAAIVLALLGQDYPDRNGLVDLDAGDRC